MNTFGSRLTETLGNRPQQWLAEQVGVTQTAVSYWLADKRQPELRTVERLAAALRIDPGWLAFGAPTVKSTACRICGVPIHRTAAYGWVHAGGSDQCETVATPPTEGGA